MAADIKMDSHKLIYHPQAVADWLSGKNIYPIEIEISPSGACNHRCIFCAVDYLGYRSDFLKKDAILNEIRFMGQKGLKSVICSGEGEPLLNKDMPDIANGIKAAGVDVAMSSNGVLFTKDKADACLESFSWIRFSVASMEHDTYNKIQQGQKDDLEKLKANLSDAVCVKHNKKALTTLGVQCLLMPENLNQIDAMAKELKEIGVDYFTIKPFSQHLHSQNHIDINYQQLIDLGEKLKEYETADYKIYYRANSMQKMHQKKCYNVCYGMPFMVHIDSRGNVWPCVAHIGMDDYCYGNIYSDSFEKIWESNQRQMVIDKIYSQDVNLICREACRLDEINKYLNELKHPGEHVNFI